MLKRKSKTKKKVIDKYYSDIYDIYLVVANENVTIEDLRKSYVFSDGVVIDEGVLEGCATTSICNDIKTGAIVILVKYNRQSKNKDLDRTLDFINIVSHEATHVALDIYELISQQICWCTPEPFCYLQAWATEHIYKSLIK